MTTCTTLTVYSTASPRAAVVLAHGAGAGQKSPFMLRTARGLAARDITVATFEFPYMAARRKVPDKATVLEDCWRDAIAAARTELGAVPLFIGGKSMGGRIASHIAAQRTEGIAGLVFLGYPLHPPGKPQQRRDAHLPQIVEPMLFVQGTRDAFGTAEEIRALLRSLQHATMYEVKGGDHSLKVAGKTGAAQDAVLEGILDDVVGWMITVTRPAATSRP
jgi:predicted alpha/beta-hydrolase family hydrolase